MNDNMCGKLYTTFYEYSVCLSCEYPNICSREVTFLFIIKHQGHVSIYTLKWVNAYVYRKVEVLSALSFCEIDQLLKMIPGTVSFVLL